MKIGILQTGHSPDELRPVTGDYADLFERLLDGQGFEFQTFSVVDGDFPEGPYICDGWLITGSKHGAYENHPWIAPLETLIRDVYALGKPMVGVCFGHQIIAQALGGKVEKYAGGWAVGPQTYDWDAQSITLNAWHQDQVTELPAEAVVVARNSFCENAALVYGNTVFTVQAHPEFDGDFVAGLIEHRGSAVPAELIAHAQTLQNAEVDNVKLAHMMGHFLKTGAL